MKTCNEYFEQIIHFSELADSEKKQIKIHSKTCEVCQKHLSEIIQINGAIKKFQQSTHFDEESLTRYGIYISDPKNADFDGKILSKQECSTIQNHLEQCSECKEKVDQIKEEFSEIESYLEDAGVPNEKIVIKSQNPKTIRNISNSWSKVLNTIQDFLFPGRYRLVPSAVMTVAMLLIIVWFSPLFRGEASSIYKMAVINKEQIQPTRAPGSQLANDGFAAFNRGDYKTTIALLEKYIQSDSVAVLLAYIHKHLGLAYLLEAEKGFLGRFESFKLENVNQGIIHLQKVLELTDNTRFKEDASWYLGKAYLMKNEIYLAKESFVSVIKLNGRKAEQAEKMLAELEKI
jgi:tetratricopeptide (TPR) repeat protein